MFYALVMSFLYIRKSRSIHVHTYKIAQSTSSVKKQQFYGWDPFQDEKAIEKSASTVCHMCHMSLNVARINA